MLIIHVIYTSLSGVKMNFSHKQHYGRDFFYPTDFSAKKFVDAFPTSSGKRKSLTLDQMQILQDLGVPFVIKEIFNNTSIGEIENANTRNKRL